jgi:hypothetical protein
MKIAKAQNNTFASPDTQANALACKRVVFLPPSPPNHPMISILKNI